MSPEHPLSCPLCSVQLTRDSLEAHLRLELDFPHLRCRLCRLDFTSLADAERHFRNRRSPHPGSPPKLLALPEDPGKASRLEELLRLAKGGPGEVERRLCVCGECRLVCREDSRGSFGQAEASSGQRPEAAFERRPAEAYDLSEAVSNDHASHEQNQQVLVSQTHQPADDEGMENMIGKEASEMEEHIPMDIKPDLNDLKPLINADGKVACIQCGMRIEKPWFKQHAIGAHSTARPFSCNLCPHNEKTKGALAKHQMKAHGSQLSEDTFTFAGSEDKIRDIVDQCFGAAQSSDWARLRCQPCDKLVNKKDASNHLGQHHLKKPLHSCKLCGYQSMLLSAGVTNTHVRKVHKGRPGPETIDSSPAQHYAPIIKNMIPQLFGKE